MSIIPRSSRRTTFKGALTSMTMGAVLLGGGMLTAPAAQASTPGWSSTPTSAPVVAKSYRRSTVAKHHTASNCWSIVDGKVYKLTKWVAKHPGGRKRIVRMCGKDASAAFHSRHGKQSRATRVVLKRYLIGTVR
jgi:cytochrome b involved in lipid metabolism